MVDKFRDLLSKRNTSRKIIDLIFYDSSRYFQEDKEKRDAFWLSKPMVGKVLCRRN
jgi:hypothetical protein